VKGKYERTGLGEGMMRVVKANKEDNPVGE
jgi:hypothetical protein